MRIKERMFTSQRKNNADENSVSLHFTLPWIFTLIYMY